MFLAVSRSKFVQMTTDLNSVTDFLQKHISDINKMDDLDDRAKNNLSRWSAHDFKISKKILLYRSVSCINRSVRNWRLRLHRYHILYVCSLTHKRNLHFLNICLIREKNENIAIISLIFFGRIQQSDFSSNSEKINF